LSSRIAESIVRRHPIVHPKWDYTAGLVLLALERAGRDRGEKRYLDYVKENVDQLVQPDGSIRTYELEDFNLDQIHEGRVLFPLYERTGDERYRKAAAQLRDQLRRQPRTQEGGFWHKKIYPDQMWLDGLYMAGPFYSRWAAVFKDPEAFDDVARQLLLVARHTRDPRTGLYYHGWDESRSQIWADHVTGQSPSFWGRAVGWYAMALVDVLDDLPESHRDRAQIVRVFGDLAESVAKVQDPVTGLWYQVLDQPNRSGNYLESSASAMFAYALAKGARRGYLAPSYRGVAERALAGLEQRVEDGADGLLSLNGVCEVAGLGGKQQRDGSFEYYMREPVVKDDYKGVGPFLLAALELGR
jgi:unsaturated rhamnogalacturonyl hydrolase